MTVQEAAPETYRHVGRRQRRADAPDAREIVMANERTQNVGQPAVAVLAETEAAAEDGVSLVDVEYEALEPIVDPVQAMNSEVAVANPRELSAEELAMHGAATATVEDAGDVNRPNVASRTRFERGDVGAALQRAEVVVEKEYRTSWVHQAYMEPQSCTAVIDALGNLTVYASTQALF